jgi:hypothetical protein
MSRRAILWVKWLEQSLSAPNGRSGKAMKQRAKHSLVDKRQNMVALLALTLLVLVMITTVNTTTTGTTHSIPHQDNNDNNAIREGSPSSATYWAETYGGRYGTDAAYSVQQTADGGYVVAGYTTSFGAGRADVWVLKLNSWGGVEWQKAYGGDYDDEARSIQQTSDGGYIVGGFTNSFDGIGGEFLVLKLNSIGSVEWQKTYGSSSHDWAFSLRQTLDGGYVVAGYTTSFGAGSGDFWVLKLNSTGGVDWQKSYGGSDYDAASSVEQTSDGGYIVAGGTMSLGVSPPYWYVQDAWVLKLGAGGDIVWDPRSGALAQNTNVTPSDSSAITFVTSVTPANSTAIVKNTGVAPHDTQAIVRVQSPPPAPTIDQPSNIAYAVGQTGYNITWLPSSLIPSMYSITRNGTIVASGSWSGTSITQSVDGLSAGRYIYTCTVNDTLSRSTSSSVQVQVFVVLPPAPTIDQPSNIAYVIGQTGYNITWLPSSQIPDYCTISVNGSSPTSYSWNGGAITYSVDGWSAGTYGVNCTVYDTLGRSVTSVVIVVVSPMGNTPVVVVGAMITTVLVSVIVALVLRRMKKPLGAVEKSTASAKPPGTKIQTKFRNLCIQCGKVILIASGNVHLLEQSKSESLYSRSI